MDDEHVHRSSRKVDVSCGVYVHRTRNVIVERLMRDLLTSTSMVLIGRSDSTIIASIDVLKENILSLYSSHDVGQCLHKLVEYNLVHFKRNTNSILKNIFIKIPTSQNRSSWILKKGSNP